MKRAVESQKLFMQVVRFDHVVKRPFSRDLPRSRDFENRAQQLLKQNRTQRRASLEKTHITQWHSRGKRQVLRMFQSSPEPPRPSIEELYHHKELQLTKVSNSYNKYLSVAARVVRRSLKDEKRLAAERRGEMELRFAKWNVSVLSMMGLY